MQLKQIMSTHTDYLPPSASIQKASNEMLEHDFGFLPIEEQGKLVGVVTDRDIAIRAVAKGLNPDTHLENIMTKKVATIHEDDDVKKAAEIMEREQIRRLVVLDKNEAISGIVSLGDIATKCKEIDLSCEIINAVSEKSH